MVNMFYAEKVRCTPWICLLNIKIKVMPSSLGIAKYYRQLSAVIEVFMKIKFRNYFKTVEKMQKNFERDASASRFNVENENLEVKVVYEKVRGHSNDNKLADCL